MSSHDVLLQEREQQVRQLVEKQRQLQEEVIKAGYTRTDNQVKFESDYASQLSSNVRFSPSNLLEIGFGCGHHVH